MRSHQRSFPNRLPALAATLLWLATVPAQAGILRFDGVVDSGSLSGTTFSGSIDYADPAAGFEGTVDLTAFSLDFAGQQYTLNDADAGTTPMAVFVAGQFIGFDFIDFDALDPTIRPNVQFTAGFSALDEASFSYGAIDAAVEGFGGYQVRAVPEPASLGLVLAGLALVASRRYRPQAAS